MSNLSANVTEINRRIMAAAHRAGRDPDAVTLIAVSKTRTLQEIETALAAGITDLGENRVQELAAKFSPIGNRANWHLIGSLQTNKARSALEMAHLIHSLDRDSLAAGLASQAERLGRVCRLLVQVNVSGEASKHGIPPTELEPFLRRVGPYASLQIRGLMTIAPLHPDPEAARPHFRRLRELADEIRRASLPNVTMEHLSMGMSGDYETAVEEGATLVRVGTALFGSRE